jgi:type IV secretory pathway TraG/TraD family ATPase VirD4
VATQSISSLRSTLSGEAWRTLLQTFRTKIFLTLSDDFSAKTASEMCGKDEQFKLNYSIASVNSNWPTLMLCLGPPWG